MAVAPVIDEIAMTGFTISGVCSRCLMVGARAVVAHRAVSLQYERIVMAAQASVTSIDSVPFGIGDKGYRGNEAVVQKVVAVLNPKLTRLTRKSALGI
jgi:hypothetical protein